MLFMCVLFIYKLRMIASYLTVFEVSNFSFDSLQFAIILQ
jgi:hypothetical protein